ncbi:MAG: hypothetical protein HZB65_01345 [Candidatus Aenigmarchaeota archaeon]|nr:hypothetical protein [Candidatus Aenigmarchaeota archaeon]
MGEQLRKLYYEAANIKNIILENKNIDILLYLAKYNPNISISDITEKFGKESLEGLKDLEKINLVREQNGQLTLTEEGIFQVEGLLTIAV